MQDHQIKLYIAREEMVRKNLDKLYEIIKGQYSHSLLAILENTMDYKDKDNNCEVLWLLEQSKAITSGLDSKANKRSNLQEAMILFLTMQQGET